MNRIQWWQQARFGMFIHWGLYALPAGVWKGKRIPSIGEWIMFNAKIPVEEYGALAKKFNPVRFDADQWVRIAREAGMKYMVLTAKHHDGFAMFKSHCDPFNIVDATPYGRDVLADLAKACRKGGLKLGVYYSQSQDWHEPHAAHTMRNKVEGDAAGFAEYLERKVKPQLRELLTNYGKIALIWFDTPAFISPEQSADLEKFVHNLQPKCMINSRIGNNHGDYSSMGDNYVPFGHIPGNWETPATINDTWGYKRYDTNWKSPHMLLRTLTRLAGRGMNYLLNVGPTGEGVIPPPSVKALEQMGLWLKQNGEAIYGTSGTPYACDFDWGDITCKPGKLFLLVSRWPGGNFVLHGLQNRVRGIHFLKTPGQKLPFEQCCDPSGAGYFLKIKLPQKAPDKNVSVIVVHIAGSARVEPGILPQSDSVISLPAHLAGIHNPPDISALHVDLKPIRVWPYGIMGWCDVHSWVEWTFKTAAAGRYKINIVSACRSRRVTDRKLRFGVGAELAVSCAGRRMKRVLADDGKGKPALSWYMASMVNTAGTIELGAGEHRLILEALKLPEKGLVLHSVDLVKIPAAASYT